MRVAAFVALFCLASLVAAETLSSSRLRGYHSFNGMELSEESFVQMRQSDFGKSLFSMLSLKFEASAGRLTAVINLLEKMAKEIQDQQTHDDAEYAAETTRLNGVIATRKAEIKAAEEEIAKLLAEQKEKTKQRDDAVALKGQEETELASRIKDLEEATTVRAKEHDAFLQRQNDQKAIVAGISAVLDYFNKNLVGNSELDAEAVNFILDRLGNLKTEFETSIESDAAADKASEADFQDFKGKQEARIAFLRKDIKRLTNLIAELNERLAQILKELAQQRAIIKTAEGIIDDCEKALVALKKKYESNKKIRKEQLSLLSAVNARLTKNPKKVQEFLNSA